MAEFVGSPLSDKELCCIATEPSRDMGSHTKLKSERGTVTNRFGKWKVLNVAVLIIWFLCNGLFATVYAEWLAAIA